MAKKKKPKEKKAEQPPDALHIHLDEHGIPFLSVDGNWSYMRILNKLNQQAELIRLDLMDMTAKNRLGYQEKMQEVLDAVKGGEDEPDQE